MFSSKFFPQVQCLKKSLFSIESKFLTRCLTSDINPSFAVLSKTQDWNRAVSDAEKIVGYPTTFFSLKCLLTEEFMNVAMHLRKLVGTNHPILKTAKRLVYNGRTNIQTRGLIVLLLSKAAGHSSHCSDLNSVGESGISTRQHTLAEITEMVYTAHLIHKGILNLSPTKVPDDCTRNDLQFGNKISILSGDYLLANACKGLASLRNCKVVELISQAIGDFMQSEFLGEHDNQGQPIPFQGISLSSWEEKNSLASASLMSNSCKATLELAGFDTTLQMKGYNFGRDLALAWQAYEDLQPFVDIKNYLPGSKFDLVSLPVIFHLEKNPHKIDLIKQEIAGGISNFDFKQLHESIMTDDSVERTRVLLRQYCEAAAQFLETLGPSSATKALSNIVNSIRH